MDETIQPTVNDLGVCYQDGCEVHISSIGQEYAEYEGKVLCIDHKDDYFLCKYSDHIAEVADKQTVNGNEDYCENCCEEHTIICESCSDYYSQDNASSLHNLNIWVCEDCKCNNYISCYGCDNWELGIEAYNCENCDYTYCSDCYNDGETHSCESDSDLERETDTSLVPCDIAGKFIKIKRYIGCEIEAENGSREQVIDNLNYRYGINEDGSLSNGTEITTPPLQLNDFEDGVKHACKAMDEAGFAITRSCGLHIHLDASDFKDDYEKITNLFKVFYAIEPIIYASLPSSRRGNTYCKPLSYDYKFTEVHKKLKPSTWDKKIYKSSYPDKNTHYNDIRYHGLNLHSIFYRGTVEFRYHSGTLNPDKIINWTNFLLHATDYAIKDFNQNKIVAIHKQKNNKKKFEATCKLLKLNKQLQKWLIMRINQNSIGYFDTTKPDSEEKYL